MKTFSPYLLLAAILLSACTQKEPAIKTPSIEGLDLTTIQNSDYFRKNLDGAKKLVEWCKQNVNPADSSSHEVVIRNLKNCKNADFALKMPVVDIMEGKTYKQY